MKLAIYTNNLEDLFSQERNNFTQIRLLLSSLVVFGHSFSLADGSTATQPYGDTSREWLYFLSGGQLFSPTLAVYFFFFLSGFLITSSFFNSNSLGHYFYKRVLRIYPAFIVCTLIGSLLIAPFSIGFEQFYNSFSFWEFLKSVVLLQQPEIPRTFLDNPYAGESNGSLWTIKLEFLAYLLVAILGGLKILRPRVVGALCILLLASHFLKQLRPELIFINDLRLYPFGSLAQYPEVLLYFFSGVFSNLVRKRIFFFRKYLAGCALLLLVTLFTGGANLILPFAGSYLLLFLGFWRTRGEKKRTESVDISYGVYLYSFPIQQFLLFLYPDVFVRNPYTLFICSYPLSCLVAYNSWHLIEKHALRLKSTSN